MSRAGNGSDPASRFDTSGSLRRMYRIEWLLGNVPDEPLEYARKLGAAWTGKRLPLRSVSVHASPGGHVRVISEMHARDVIAAVADWVDILFDAVREQGLSAPGYVMAAAAVSKEQAV